ATAALLVHFHLSFAFPIRICAFCAVAGWQPLSGAEPHANGMQCPTASQVPPVHAVPEAASWHVAVQHEAIVRLAAPSSDFSPASTTPSPQATGPATRRMR